LSESDLPNPRERGLYIGILEFMWTISGGLGPILGGVFSEYVSWRWNFWINLPICAIAFLLLFFYLDVHNPRTPMIDGLKAIDWLGSASILGFTLMVLLGLNFGGEVFPWDSANVICLLVFGALCIGVFYYGEKYVAKYPLMPLELLKDRSVVATLLVTLFHGAVSHHPIIIPSILPESYVANLTIQNPRSSSPANTTSPSTSNPHKAPAQCTPAS
jgi:MFS family permease